MSACGWIVQNRDEMNLTAGPGVAVREFATARARRITPCSWIRRFCGVIEAKPPAQRSVVFPSKPRDISPTRPISSAADPKQRRFEYVASDTETMFRDLADPEPRSRRVFTFHRPETLRRWLSEPETLRARLRHMPPLVTEGLRTCQIEAIEGLENSLARDDPRALIQMTMGAGKTFTACTASYRLLAHAGMRRILFLVDRRNLGNQTATEYAGYRPPGTGRLFPELYGVQKLGPAGLDNNSADRHLHDPARLFRADRQGTRRRGGGRFRIRARRRRARSSSPTIPAIPIETFDLIVTDECHRSIYGSWRQVLEYFDGFIVGLTATPPCTRSASSTRTSSPNIPTSGRWSTASTSATRSIASAPASAKQRLDACRRATPSRCGTRRPAPQR